jgi:glycosyltransferase involved in cell wall biosynthesis
MAISPDSGPAPTNDAASRLSIVLPAYNEEQSIGATIEACLAAAEPIRRRTGLGGVEIIVVSDGSTDRTAQIAAAYDGIRLVAYRRNRGYGAALKAGFAVAGGDWLGFMDADGTCDPRFFADLYREARRQGADLVSGSRMHAASRMPRLRRLGNRFYAALLAALSGRAVLDTASGMRVLRREALDRLLPLPDGLHFTPAMTCRAIFQEDVTLGELPMPYRERQGRSKLNLLGDGLRFLSTIAEIALTYRPLRLFGGMAALLFAVGLAYSVGPVHTYLLQRQVPADFIYRLTAVSAAGLAGLTLLTIGIVAERVAGALNRSTRRRAPLADLLLSVCSVKNMLWAGVLPFLGGIVLNWSLLREYLATGRISYHWSYVSLGSFLVLAGMQLAAMGLLELLLSRILERNRACEARLRPAAGGAGAAATPGENPRLGG